MKKIIVLFFILVIPFVFLSSCKKGPGQGGRATIKGKVWTRKHLSPTKYDVVDSYPDADDDVYIIYGDETSWGDHQKTDYQGDFEFNYMRKGNYKIYVYSDDSVKMVAAGLDAALVPKMAIVKDTIIKDRKQVIDVGTITVLH